MHDVTAMSQYANEFSTIIDSILVRYYDKCVSKIEAELKDTLSGIALIFLFVNITFRRHIGDKQRLHFYFNFRPAMEGY